MWGQIGDKEANGPFTVTWHGKAKPSALFSENHVKAAERMIYCIYSHTITLNNVTMTDAWEQS